MVVGLHLLQGCLIAVASIDDHAFGHLKTILISSLGDSAQVLQTMFTGKFQFILEGIEVIAPHLTGDVLTHTIALCDNFDNTLVASGSLAVNDTAGGRIVDSRHRIMVGRLLHAVKSSDSGQLYHLSVLQQFND